MRKDKLTNSHITLMRAHIKEQQCSPQSAVTVDIAPPLLVFCGFNTVTRNVLAVTLH